MNQVTILVHVFFMLKNLEKTAKIWSTATSRSLAGLRNIIQNIKRNKKK
jgi:hypothetical protein